MTARPALIAVLGLPVLFAALLAAAGTWLLYSESGLVWSIARMQQAVPGLTIGGASGTWVHGVGAVHIEYRSADLQVTADQVSVVLSPWSVLRAQPRVSALNAARVNIVMPDSDERTGPPDTLALPLDLDIAEAHIAELNVDRAGTRETVNDIALSYAGGKRRHELIRFDAHHDMGRVTGKGTLAAARPFALSATASVELRRPEPLTVTAKLGGTLVDMRVDATVKHAAATAQVDALVTPFDATPVARVHATSADIDMRAFDPALPHTRMAIEVALEPNQDAWLGPVRVTNALAGPWDKERLPVTSASAQLTVHGATARLADLRVDLGGSGRLTGDATLEKDRAVLHLAARQIDLRALQSQLRATQLGGRMDLDLTRARQRASAQLRQDDIELAFDADRRGDDVRVPRFVARSRGSEARGEGRITLSGARLYAASARLAGFDPSAWGDFPKGSINGRIDVEGALQREEIRVEYALSPSRLLGEPLSGAGRFAYARQRVYSADVRMAWAGNQVAARGAFGGAGDVLDARIDAGNMAALDARIAGAVSGTARLSGTMKAPQVEVDLAGRKLAFRDYGRAATAALRGEYRAGPLATFRGELRASSVQAAGWSGEQVDITASGAENAHVLAVRARGGDLDLALQARGGWNRASGWSGTLEQLRNAGAVDFGLEGPVAVALGEQRATIGPFAARLMGGDIAVSGFRYRNGAIESEGRFSRLPLRPVAALAGVAMGPRDTLRLSGSWSVKREARLTIAFGVQRDSGDLNVGTTQPLPLGIEALHAEGRLANGKLQMQATLKSALATGTAEGSIATTAADGSERIAKTSPLRFTADLEVARLALLSPLIGTSFHVDGRMRAALSGTGTVGAPIVSGTVDADRLAVALPPQGIDLRDGVLHARVQSNRIDVQQFSIRGGSGTLTARGELALAADRRATVNWRADRLAVLARPDRRLVVTGSGNALLDRGKLALNGTLRADEGRFQFGESSLPSLGPDVVVVGRASAPEEATTLSKTTLNLTLDFGNDLHIAGEGLDAWIEGRVIVTTGAKGDLRANGTVRTQRGTYSAFGQRLQIDRGQLTFGGPVENPGLDIVAMRKNQAVEAGVAVTGTVRAPFVRIVSDPPVPESDALSWLVLGHGPADASRADLAMLPLAAAALFGPANSGQGSFAKRLGVDTISVRSNGTLSNQVVAVGKRISNRLYVIYEQGVGTTTTVLKVEYNLTRRFLLRAEAGQVSAAGVFFRYAFD